MASHTDSNPQLYQPRSASAAPTTSDELANPVPALSTSQRPPDATEERVNQPRSSGSAPADNQSTPPNEYCESNCELVLRLSQLPADIFDKQAGEPNREKMCSMTDQNDLPSVPTTRSLEEVW